MQTIDAKHLFLLHEKNTPRMLGVIVVHRHG